MNQKENALSRRLAAVQLQSSDDVAGNLRACAEQVAGAAARGADLVLLPENFAFFGAEEARGAIAEDLEEGSGPIMTALREMAEQHSVCLIGGGMPERSPDPLRPYNTSVAVDAGGRMAGRYRKVHLFDVRIPGGMQYLESGGTSAGDRVVVVELGGLRVALSVCYDLRFPRLYEAAAAAGADVLTVPAAFTLQTGLAHWTVLLRARAIENQCWLLAANQWGLHPGGRQTYGHSALIDPWGTVVAQCGDGVGCCVGDVELAKLQAVRERMPCASHRRAF